MWDDFSSKKSESYLDHKFNPRHKVGLSNYLREFFTSKMLDPHQNDIILDAGCASGHHLFSLSNKIKEGYGTDIADSFIKQANVEKERIGAKNLFFQKAEIEHMPFPNEFFDKIICAEVLEHVPDKNLALRELLKILKKEGIIVVTTPNLNSDGTIWGRFLRLIGFRKFSPIRYFTKEELEKHGDCHVREFDRIKLCSWLRENGLLILDARSTSFIDGPFLKVFFNPFLRFRLPRKFIIKIEKFLTNQKFFFGKNLIIKAIKK